MNTTELVALIAASASVPESAVTVSLTRDQSLDEYTVAVTFVGSLSEIISVENNIFSGAFATNFQAALTASAYLAGKLFLSFLEQVICLTEKQVFPTLM